MHQPLHTTLRIPALLAVAALALSACKSSAPASSGSTPPAPSARISQEASVTAQVVGLDQTRRIVTLRGEDGRLRQVVAPPEVRNFDQIAVGDRLNVRCQAMLMATQLPPGEEFLPAQGAVAAARAAKGSTPAAGFEVALTVRVRIESIDAAHDIFVFASASGDLLAQRITTDAGREFVKKLKVGDLVQLDYGQALAMAIEKVPG